MTRAFDAAEQAFGTVTVLVNNAGVVTSGRAVDVSEEEWRRVDRHQSRCGVLRVAGGGAAHAGRRQGRRDRQHRLDARDRRREGRRALCGVEGGRDPAHQGAGGRARVQGHPRQRHRAGLDRHRSQPRLSRERAAAPRSSARFRPAVSARRAISTARCCCSRPTPAASSPARRSSSTAGRWWRCGGRPHYSHDTSVMPGLVPGIHVFLDCCNEDVDGRDKPGHDGETCASHPRRPVRRSAARMVDFASPHPDRHTRYARSAVDPLPSRGG